MSNLHNVGWETAVLSGLINNGPEAYVAICDIIDNNTFYTQQNKILYKCIEKILAQGDHVDVTSILESVKQMGMEDVFDFETEIEHIKDLTDFVVHPENLPSYAKKLKTLQIGREMLATSQQISKSAESITGEETVDEILGIIEKPFAKFLTEEVTGSDAEWLAEGIDEYIEDLIENPVGQVGIPTGFPRYDAAIGGGLRRGAVDLISARPKTGKSVFGDCVAINVAKRGIPVLMIDTEMSKDDHYNRIIANLTGIPINDIATGKFSQDDEKVIAVQNAVEEIKEMSYTYVSVAGKPFDEMLSHIKKWILQTVGKDEYGQTKECLVVFDYLKLMSTSAISNNTAEFQLLGDQITKLHNLSVKYSFSCLCFTQLNRDGITKETTDAVSGSDRLIWLCTSWAIFKAKGEDELAEDGPSYGNRKLVPVVARHGGGMQNGNYINITLGGEYARLTEISTRDEMYEQRATGGAIEGSNVPFELDGVEDGSQE